MNAVTGHDLPRDLVDGVSWLGQCQLIPFRGQLLHSCNSAYLVSGDRYSALIDSGMTCDAKVIQRQLEIVLTSDRPPLRYLFVSHHESPHVGGVGRLMALYPETVACGNVADLHLIFPEFTDRLVPLDPGDELDLGGTKLQVVEAVFRDMPYTRWAFDTRRRVLFPADGFAYTHLHNAEHCGHLVEETVGTLELGEMTARFADAAFHWTQFVDIAPYLSRLDDLLAELHVDVVAPTHGLPILDLPSALPEIRRGYLAGSVGEEQSMVELAYTNTRLT